MLGDHTAHELDNIALEFPIEAPLQTPTDYYPKYSQQSHVDFDPFEGLAALCGRWS